MVDKNPYAPPEAPPAPRREAPDASAPRPYVDGDALVVHAKAKLPKRCIKCATKADLVDVPTPFVYVPPWARLAFGALGALVFQETVTIALRFCQSCQLVLQERQRAFRRVAMLGLALMAVPSILFFAVDRTARGPAGLFAVLGFVAGFALIVVRQRRDVQPYAVRSSRVRQQEAWILGACAAYVDRATRPPKSKA